MNFTTISAQIERLSAYKSMISLIRTTEYSTFRFLSIISRRVTTVTCQLFSARLSIDALLGNVIFD